MYRFAFLLLALLPAVSFAEVIDTAGAAPGTYLLTIAADGRVSVSPTRVVRLADLPGGPTLPPPVEPGAPTELSKQVQTSVKLVLTAGGSPTTASGLSSVCSLLSEEVKAGRIATADAVKAASQGFDKILAVMPDGGKWVTFRGNTIDALNTLQAQGKLQTKEQWAGVLMEFSRGIDLAVGTSIKPREIAKITGQAQLHKQAELFENIDLAQLIELIKLIMELFKLFGGGF